MQVLGVPLAGTNQKLERRYGGGYSIRPGSDGMFFPGRQAEVVCKEQVASDTMRTQFRTGTRNDGLAHWPPNVRRLPRVEDAWNETRARDVAAFWMHRGVDATTATRLAGMGRNVALFRDRERLMQRLEALQELLPDSRAERLAARAPVLLKLWGGHLATKYKQLGDLLPDADVAKMVDKQPSLLCMDVKRSVSKTLSDLEHVMGPDTCVQKMVERQPGILMYTNAGKQIVPKIYALKKLLPKCNVNLLLEKNPSLLTMNVEVSVAKKIHRLRRLTSEKQMHDWCQRPATLARILNCSHSVIDRLEYCKQHCPEHLASASAFLIMPKSLFDEKFPEFQDWREKRTAPAALHETKRK
eukprot:jgi/Pico_ML_1/51651/g228.t1